MPRPLRGEVWRVRFDPSEGAEIQKVRPAVVIGRDAVGRLPLRIVVPITEWKPAYIGYPWMVRLDARRANGLIKESGADSFQVKSVAESRFQHKLGTLTADDLDNIAAAIALCVGAP